MSGTTGGVGYSLKSVRTTTVNTGMAPNYYSELTWPLGNSRNCIASPQLMYDDYGRKVRNPLSAIKYADPSCSTYVHPASQRIDIENNERPYVPIPQAGNRGFGDFMGVYRDEGLTNLYGPSAGGFKRTYLTRNDAAPSTSMPAVYGNAAVGSMDMMHDRVGDMLEVRLK